jgi:hypothetical protein
MTIGLEAEIFQNPNRNREIEGKGYEANTRSRLWQV